MNVTAFMLRLLLFMYFPFLALLWLGIAVIEVFLAVKMLFIVPPILFFMIFLAIPLFHIPWACRCLFWRPPADELEARLPRGKMKGLLRFIRTVALEQNLPEPGLVRFHANSVAHVCINHQGEKVLVLGGMALRCISQDALAGIVAHELGHLAAGDAQLSRRCFRRSLLMGLLGSHLVLLIKPQGPVWFGRTGFMVNPLFWIFLNLLNPVPWVIVGYHRLFKLLYAANSRQQEFAADRFSAEHCGNQAAAETLIFVHVIEKVPSASIRGIADLYLATNTPVNRIFSEQAASTGRIDSAQWEKARRKALAAKTGWFDSHPCLRERLAALGVSLKIAQNCKPEQSGPPAAELVDDWETLESRLTGYLMAILHEQFQWEQDMQMVEEHLANKSK